MCACMFYIWLNNVCLIIRFQGIQIATEKRKEWMNKFGYYQRYVITL